MKKYLILLVLILTMSELATGAIRYVTPKGAGLKNGISWKNAYDSSQLQTAINEPDIKGVYVAAGTYKPTTGTDRNISFNLKSGIEIYGGFNGTETSYTQRNWIKNVTILSGDIGIPGDNSDNSYHVVTSVLVTSAILHGFTIQDGNADANSANFYDGCGGGIFNSSSSPKIINCLIKNNAALYRGGGICNLNSSPYITNCEMSQNSAFSGGGIADVNSSATLTNCLLNGNQANNGCGMLLEYKSSSVLNNCIISNNNGVTGGGLISSLSAARLTNCLIINNRVTGYGGGLSADSSMTLINCTVAGNSSFDGGGIHNNCTLMLSIKNSVIWGNKGTSGNQIYNNKNSRVTLNYSCYSNGLNDIYNEGTISPDAYCINTNPEFINPGFDFRIAINSPCADAGNNSYNNKTTDIRGAGYGRKLLKADSSVAGTIDMGAYEYNSGTDPAVLPEPQLTRIFVKWDASGADNGTTWADAFTSLQSALSAATTGCEIWVAAGTYKPTNGTDRTISFNMKNGVAIYGGFNGTETMLSQRNWTTNVTILSGDLNGNDVVTGSGETLSIAGNVENSQHVVFNSSIDSTASIDGFVIKGGNADIEQYYVGGGGIKNSSASPNISNCVIIWNSSYNMGGGISNSDNSSPTLINCRISENSANEGGGVNNSYSAATFTNCKISGNSANLGGGILNTKSSSMLINCIIFDNYARTAGGGMLDELYCLPTLINCTIFGNSAGSGGGISSYKSSETLINCTLTSNHADIGGGVFGIDLSLSTNNSIIWGNTAINEGKQFYFQMEAVNKISLGFSCYSNKEGDVYFKGNITNISNENCITTDPKFVNTATNDFRLTGNSPCTDAGNNAYNSQTTDIRGPGYGRKLLKTDSAIAGTIDMGAYEYNSGFDPAGIPEPPLSRIYVKVDASGANNGTNWANAFTSLQSALSASTSGSEIWVAAGTYKPTTGTDRTISFNMKNGVAIYGGFVGTETLLSQRNYTTNVTILSGDLNGDDVVTGGGTTLSFSGNTENTYHIIVYNHIDSTASIDGFTVKGGNAADNVNDYINSSGGGIHNYRSTPTITNCVITENSAIRGGGGGIFNYYYSSPKLLNCTISKNSAGYWGGGIFNDNFSSPMLLNCKILGNSASMGGGIAWWQSSSCSLFNCLIINNKSDYGGGIYMASSISQLTNCTIAGNSARWGGGGIHNEQSSSPSINNSIIWGNSGLAAGNQINQKGGTITLNYSCYANGINDIALDWEAGTLKPTNCISTYPQFVNPSADFRIAGNSPCADAGNNAFNSQTTDIRGPGYGRKLLKTDSATAGTIDIGAYEYNSGTDPAALPEPQLSRIYVKWNASGSDNGTNWADAYNSLQSALSAATNSCEIWVAAGTYKPTAGTDSTISFSMKNGVSIYGGFVGTETLLSQRNWTTNVTILSGDLNGDDVVTGSGETLSISGNTENSRHVINNYNIDNTASIDGFTIQGGNADSEDKIDGSGGGIHNNTSFPIITNCFITRNSSKNNGGGGMFNYNFSSPTFLNCRISENFAKVWGGGMFNHLYSSPTLINCRISGNAGSYGGGMSSEFGSFSKLTNCLIADNTSMYAGGGVYLGSAALMLTNCTISGNSSSDVGGGMYFFDSWPIIIINSIVWGNKAILVGKQIYNSGSMTFNHSCFPIGVDEIYIEGEFTLDTNSINKNPEFANPCSDFRIAANSPCADAGNNAFNTQATDIRGPGYGRKLLKTDSAIAGTIDMGAYEYNSEFDPAEPLLSRIYVKWDASGADNGTSWTNAYTSLPSALSAASKGCEIWVAAGTYKPTTGSDRSISFNMKNGVAIYGGFAGTETLLNQRNWTSNVTILSGDLNGDDVVTGSGATLSITGNAENSRHVVFNSSVDSTASINGFTIKGGNADSEDKTYGSGGGIFNSSSSPSTTNCIITGNSSKSGGGGIMNSNYSSPKINNCRISENFAKTGGGISIIEGSSSTFINCQIRNNKSISGAGIYISGKGPNLINCLIANNYATDEGGGVYMDEALGAYGDSFLYLSNCTVVGNSANSGGGILNSNTMINVRNSIIWDNHATTKGNQICVYGNMNAMSLTSSCFSTGESDVYDYYGTFSADTYCKNENPKFINPGSDFRITANSPCTDAGNNGYNSQLTDIRGQGYDRKLLQTDSAIAGTIDMGAYEYNTGFDPAELPFPTLSRIYVKWDALGVENGSSWDDAFTSLRPALRIATTGNEIWVAAGTYKPGFGSFNMKNGVAIYGGFAGNESLLSERNQDVNTSVLMGEPYKDVVYNSNIDSTASLDGFTIQGGQVDHDKPESGGSGIHNSFSCPTITNCVITGNNSLWHYGAGINNANYSSPKLVNCRISDNTDYGAGGGIANSNYSSPTLYNCIISNNHATRYGIGGGIYNYDFSSPKLINCTISANTAMYGGGLYNDQSSSLSLKNSIIWGNGFGNQIYNSGGTILLDYSCYANVTYDIITEEGTITASNCIITDPVFVNPTSDFRISGTSPCIDAGYNSYNTESFDLRGQPRIYNSKIDMGAYEWTGGFDPLRFIVPTGLPGEVTEAIKVFELDGVITIVSGLSITGKAKVTDMAGRTIAMQNLVAGSPLHFNQHLVPGVYMVSVLTKNQTLSQKIVIR